MEELEKVRRLKKGGAKNNVPKKNNHKGAPGEEGSEIPKEPSPNGNTNLMESQGSIRRTFKRIPLINE